MLALLASFLTSVLIINICPIPANFAPEARIHNFVAWDKEVWSRAGNSIWSFSARNFPQLHLRPANADLATTTAEKPDCPVRKPEASSFVLEQGSAAAWDEDNQTFLFQARGEKKRPIASISKLMTALVFLDNNPGWDHVYEITRQDRREGGRIFVYLGDRVQVKDLFNISLVASANTATMALVHSTGLTEEEFVKEMNSRAGDIGLVKTEFRDVSGLSRDNVSTAKEVVKLAQEALDAPEIREAVLREKYRFSTQQGDTRVVLSTDDLLKDFPYKNIDIRGGKTGYTPQAGYCFVGGFRKQGGENELISVILGAEEEEDRFEKTRELIDWAYTSYRW